MQAETSQWENKGRVPKVQDSYPGCVYNYACSDSLGLLLQVSFTLRFEEIFNGKQRNFARMMPGFNY